MFQSVVLLVGRILMSVLFLWAAAAKLMALQGTVSYMASKHMPYIYWFLAGALFLQIAGGISLLLGYRARWGVWMLIIFIIPASVVFHDFWNSSGSTRLIEQMMFMKDMAILGGLFAFTVAGPGSYSFDKS
jgi:putative oxidoreductase